MVLTDKELSRWKEQLSIGLGWNVTPDEARRLIAEVERLTTKLGLLLRELSASTCRVDELEDQLAAALDVIIAVENKDRVFVVDGSVATKSLADALGTLQVRLDEETKPYSERRLVVRRRPEYGWAVWDKDTGEKLRPVNPNQWFRDRKTALAAKATEQPPVGVK